MLVLRWPEPWPQSRSAVDSRRCSVLEEVFGFTWFHSLRRQLHTRQAHYGSVSAGDLIAGEECGVVDVALVNQQVNPEPARVKALAWSALAFRPPFERRVLPGGVVARG